MRIIGQKIYLFLFTIAFILVICLQSGVSQTSPIYNTKSVFHPVVAANAMVSSQEKLATEAGLQVLQEGGNAVDAAVTVGFALAVTLPRAGNIGGGGFMMIHLAANKQTIALDYREKAPLRATAEMFLDEQGNVESNKSRFSHLAVGVPGTVAGLVMALEEYGTISLARALQPAIALAEEGFPVTQDLYESLTFARRFLAQHPESKSIFYPQGNPPAVGEIFSLKLESRFKVVIKAMIFILCLLQALVVFI